MAKILDKDPFTYEREKKEFLHALRQYHATKGVQPAMFRMPKVSGRDLDLYLLYCKVVSLGGVVKVTNERNWDLVSEALGFPPGCSQIGYVIRQHYIRYLESYEKVHFKGEDDDEARAKRPHTPISFAYRKEISDKVRQTHGFAKEKCRTSEYDRIIHSLQSGLPNEVDFAINICTLLSNEGKHVIHLEKAPMLIDLLLAHAGIFYEGPGSLRKLYEEDWMAKTKRKFVQFWYDTVSDKEVREVIGPGSKKPEDKRLYKDVELFAVRKMGLSDVEGQRILQIAIIFRNLSFESHHISTMASHRTLYRFLLLLAHNSCTMLQQLGMDTLTNICNQIVLDSIDYVSTQLMLHTIHKGLLSHSDKFVALRSMELMEKLLMVDNNLDLFQRCLEPTIYVKIITLLTIHDIQLLLGALEVMLVMSEREEPFCSRISSVHHSIDVLVCLVTLDAQSLGADAFVGIKIVDHVPDGIHHPIVTMGRPGMTPTQPPQPSPAQHSTTQPQRPAPAASNSSASPTPPPPAQNSQVRDGEMENLASQWLGAHYEMDHVASITNIDLYAEYLSACGKIMGRSILNSNDFMKCVKMVFPAVEGKKAETEAGPQFLIAGIKRRRVPLQWKFQPNQSAPSPSASAMIARMAQRHSPSPTVSPSPPPPKGGVFTPGIPQGVPPGIPPGIPQRQLVAPPVGPVTAPLPGQVHGQIPGHIHGPMVPSTPVNLPTPGQILGQTGQLPAQIQLQVPTSGPVAQVGVVAPRTAVPVMQQPIIQKQVVQAPAPAPSIGQVPQSGGYSVAEKQQQQPNVLPLQLPQGAPPKQLPQGAQLQQPIAQSPQGENVSVADIVAGNMRVPQQQLNFGLQQHNGKQVNGQIAPGQALNGPQNFVGTPGVTQPNNSGAPVLTGTEQLLSKSIPQTTSSAIHLQDQSQGTPVLSSVISGNGQHHIQSDTNSESSVELSSKSKSRSRSNSGKSGRKTPSRQSSKSPSRKSGGGVKSPKPSGDEASTEKCQPPLNVPLPDGEVRIEKIPNMHAVGVDQDDEDSEDRTDLAEGIIRQIAGSPVLNRSSCDVPMESESLISEADTTEDEGSQTPKMNGGMSTPDLQPPQRMQGLVTTVSDSIANSQAGVFSQPPQQTKAAQQFTTNSNSQQVGVIASQSQPQQQYVIQQQIPAQAVASRGVVVQTHPVSLSSGTVVRSSQGTVLQTQGGNFVQVQPQVVQGHQTVIHNQANFQGQQFQTTQMPLHVTLFQQPTGQGQVQQQIQPQQQQQKVNVVTGVQHLQSGQTMIMTNSKQATILSQNQGQVVLQNVGTPPRTGPKPILPQPSPVSSSAQGPRPILPQPQPNQMAQIQGTQTFQIATPIQHHQVHTTTVAQVQANAQNVQIARFPGIQRLQGQLSPTNRDSPLIKRLLQQGPALQAAPGQQQVQVIPSPQQGQIVLNTIGQSQGTPMAVQTQGQAMPLSHVQVVSPFPQAMSVQSSPTIANIPQIQLHPQPILPNPTSSTIPNMNNTKSKKKSKHKKKDKEKDRDKNKSSGMKEDLVPVGINVSAATNGEKDGGKGYSINVISEEGDKKVVGVVCNGLPVPTRTESNECNNPGDSPKTPTKQGLPNGFMNDKLHSGIKLAKESIASKDIETLLKKTPQTIGDKVDIEQMKRDRSSGENGILADKLGKPCLNHVINGDMGSRAESPLLKENYDSNNTVSDKLDKLFHGAVPNLSQSNIPNASTPNPKSLVAFCHDIRPSFSSTVPSVTVGAVANANNNNQQNSCPSVPVSTISLSSDKSTASSRTQISQINSNSEVTTSSLSTPASTQAAKSTPSTTSSQTSLPLPAQQPPSPLTVQVPSPSTASAQFKRPIDDVLSSPDPKQSSNPAPSPTTPTPTPPSPSPSASRSSKKRRRHSSSSSTSSSSRKSSSGKAAAPPVVPKYVCEWKGCSRKLVSGKALHTHTCIAHILTINYRGICEWEGCDRIQRQRWSVVSHIMDKHCSEQAVQASMEKRAQRAAQPTPPPSQDSSPQPPPIVYNAHTAYHAIRRSLNTPSLNEFLGENEGPVTKSIRLTAALILKNLATHSAVGRKEIRRHELLLARLAISNTESSTTLAKCLNKLELDS